MHKDPYSTIGAFVHSEKAYSMLYLNNQDLTGEGLVV
jgi:hypothetical protein